ncbi:MAG: phytanoyl-CoA dioxygenase family protein [Leptospiraceae bacterium]|nr:phytanoyl-CoA dioxygenase family protein [Leptospiraceae bacterium]
MKNKNDEIQENGFTFIPEVYSVDEVREIIYLIDNADKTNDTFRKSSDLFAIRQFLKEIPKSVNLIFNKNLKLIIEEIFGKDYFVVKSIYFDKPEDSNWYVNYHQDLTISVDVKAELEGFSLWTSKQNQFAVQPPIEILKSIFTIRIHLDDTDSENGALKVIPKSHSKEIYKHNHSDWETENEVVCEVSKGGIMIMKPLLLHSSSRTTNNKKRRVIHIEFSNKELPTEVNWSERLNF